MKKYLVVLTLIALGFIIKGQVSAAVRCESQYGGGETCTRTGEILIDKKVLNPSNSSYVDNLGLNTYRFSANDEITFKIIVKNVGDETLNNIEVHDNLPNHLEYVSGDLSYTIGSLSVGQTDERTVKVKVSSDIPSEVTCVTNYANAKTVEFDPEDSSQVCFGKGEQKILGEKTPATGPEMLLPLLVASSTGFLGLSLIRKFKAN